MAELIKVIAIKQKPDVCFQIFNNFLERCKLEKKKRREPQAMFNNIFRFCSQFKKQDEAKQYFDKYSYILDKRNLALFHQLFGW